MSPAACWANCSSKMPKFGVNEDNRKEELIRLIERSVKELSLGELEALYYDMYTKGYIQD